MIKKSVVSAFRKKKLDDYTFLKRMSEKDIRDVVFGAINNSNGTFKFKTDPYKHQFVSFYIGICVDQFLFFLDMGLGKSKVSLDIISCRGLDKTLVLVPFDINIESWEEEVKLHSELVCVPMYGTTEERWRLLNEPGNIYVLNYAGLMHMLCRHNKKKEKFEIHRPTLQKFGEMFDAIIMDELHLAKNHKSLVFRILRALSKIIKCRWGLTGTPFGRDPQDLWSQFYLIDHGETMGDTLGIMRDAFFAKVFNKFGFSSFELVKKYKRHLFRRMHNRSIRYADTECQDLPKMESVVKHVSLNGAALDYFNQAVNGIIEADGNRKKIDNAYIRMRQISSGFIQLKDSDGNKLPIIYFPDNPKLQALKSLCLEMGAKMKMIIFVRFVPSGDLIIKMLKDLKLPFATAVGKTKDAAGDIKRFKNDPEIRFLVASVDGGAGLGANLQIANHVTFYESPESPIKRKQCVKRVWRNGQKRRVRFVDIVARASITGISVEQRILDYLEEGNDLFSALLEGKDALRLSKNVRVKLLE